MAKLSGRTSRARFAAYVEKLTEVIGHADRAGPLRHYCTGLLMPAERKSVEPMAAVTAPARVAAQHQSLLHFVANAPWSDQALLAKVREIVLPEMTRTEPVAAWIIDDTGFPKKGRHSVGVARQYCGQLGKQDNCQVAVSLSLANHSASLPVSYRLYLPRDWAEDPARRAKAGVPEEIAFQTKPEIALELLRAAAEAGLPRGVAVVDAGYGKDTEFRTGVSALGLLYVAAVLSSTTVWPPGTGPLPPRPWSGRGRRATRLRRDAQHQPVPVKAVALGLPETAWTEIAWRAGTNAVLRSRFQPGARRACRHPAERAARRGVAADRVARGRTGANPVLAVDPARGDRLRADGRPGAAALADRAGLPGSQAGSRARALRGPRLARLPPSRHSVHRGLWLPDRRAGEIFPLRPSSRRGLRSASPFRGLPTARRPRSGPSGTCRTRSRPCDGGSPWRWPGACTDARAAHASIRAIRPDPPFIAACDAVVIRSLSLLARARSHGSEQRQRRSNARRRRFGTCGLLRWLSRTSRSPTARLTSFE